MLAFEFAQFLSIVFQKTTSDHSIQHIYGKYLVLILSMMFIFYKSLEIDFSK